jgi:hypothetical protein
MTTERTLRTFLSDSPSAIAQAHLKNLELVERLAHDLLFSGVAPDAGSHVGLPHCRNVERQIDALLIQAPRLVLTPTEAFVLLTAILLHDLGKVETAPAASAQTCGTFCPRLVGSLSAFREGSPHHHQSASALALVGNPTRWGLHDIGIVDAIARVIALHDPGLRNVALRDGWLGNVFLDRFGEVRVAQLGALLSLADDMDTSYHRMWDGGPTPLAPGSKGDYRSCIQGCEVDTVGRVLVLHPAHHLLASFIGPTFTSPPPALTVLFADINAKERLIHAWCAELKEMGLELRSCMLAVDSNLVTTRYMPDGPTTQGRLDPPAASGDIGLGDFVLGIEPNLTPMKVERVLDAAVRLSSGVFGKDAFSWEMLATEAGMESVEEVRRIFARIAAIASLRAQPTQAEWYPDGLLTGQLRDIEFVSLTSHWSLNCTATRSETSAAGPQLIRVQDEVRRRFALCFDAMAARVDAEATKAGHHPEPGPAAKTTATSGGQLHYCSSNADLNYLLDEDLCRKVLGRGFKVPAYYPKSAMPEDTAAGDLPYRPLGVNVVVAGPPGVGKSSLALEIIASVMPIACQKGSEHCPPEGVADRKATGVAAYVLIEQPQVVMSGHLSSSASSSQNGVGNRLPPCPEAALRNSGHDVKALAYTLRPFGETYNLRMGWGYRDLYQSLTSGADQRRVVLLCSLSPRIFPDHPGNGVDHVFWQRFKQLSRLCDHGPWYDACWVPHRKERSHNMLRALVIDNLNAFGQGALGREQVHQIFRMTAWSGVLAIHLLECDDAPDAESQRLLNDAAFMSDVFIRLSWAPSVYRHKQIEILKARFQRHVLGPHPYKIRGNRLRIYPSLHTEVVRAHQRARAQSDAEGNTPTPAPVIPLLHGLDAQKAPANGLVLLQGPRGSFKLSIALLYARAAADGERVLFFNFGPEFDPAGALSPINMVRFPSGACLNEGAPIPETVTPADVGVPPAFIPLSSDSPDVCDSNDKWVSRSYSIGEVSRGAQLRLVHLDTGYLMPEEALAFVRQFVAEDDPSRIVLYSLYHLPFRFPLLAENDLFLSHLLQIVRLEGRSVLLVTSQTPENPSHEVESLHTGLRSSADLIMETSRPSDKKEPGDQFVDVSFEDVTVRRYRHDKARLWFNMEAVPNRTD